MKNQAVIGDFISGYRLFQRQQVTIIAENFNILGKMFYYSLFYDPSRWVLHKTFIYVYTIHYICLRLPAVAKKYRSITNKCLQTHLHTLCVAGSRPLGLFDQKTEPAAPHPLSWLPKALLSEDTGTWRRTAMIRDQTGWRSHHHHWPRWYLARYRNWRLLLWFHFVFGQHQPGPRRHSAGLMWAPLPRLHHHQLASAGIKCRVITAKKRR